LETCRIREALQKFRGVGKKQIIVEGNKRVLKVDREPVGPI